MQLSVIAVSRTAEQTEGFSFAYLKELFLSATMGWLARSATGVGMDTVMGEQVTLLRQQMFSAAAHMSEARPATVAD